MTHPNANRHLAKRSSEWEKRCQNVGTGSLLMQGHSTICIEQMGRGSVYILRYGVMKRWKESDIPSGNHKLYKACSDVMILDTMRSYVWTI